MRNKEIHGHEIITRFSSEVVAVLLRSGLRDGSLIESKDLSLMPLYSKIAGTCCLALRPSLVLFIVTQHNSLSSGKILLAIVYFVLGMV
jgi:hypothetical protein